MIRKFLLAVFIFYAGLSNADVLFIDLNNAPKEIEIARKEALARNEKLIVIPPIDNKGDRRRLPPYVKAEEDYNKALSDLQECKAQVHTTTNCDSEIKTLNTNKTYFDHLKTSNMPERFIDPGGLDYYLKQLRAQNLNFSTVILSGHHETGTFSGDFGFIQQAEMEKIFKKNAPLGDNVRSLFLWGCYSMTLHNAFDVWGQTFPHVRSMLGYEYKGYLKDDPRGLQYLQKALSEDARLSKITDLNDLQAAFRQLPNVMSAQAAICVGNNYVTANRKISKEQIESLCPEKTLRDIMKKSTCYVEALPGCTTIPLNTKTSELRTLYESIQQYAHCSKFKYYFEPPSESVIRLIFYPNVVKNYERNNRPGLEAFNALAAASGIPENLQFKNLTGLSRDDITKRIKTLDILLEKQSRIENFKNGNPAFETLRNSLILIKAGLGALEKGSIPSNWIEPDSRVIQTSDADALIYGTSKEKLNEVKANMGVKGFFSRFQDWIKK